MYTFGLAMLGQFGPTTDLTDIRDRLVGIAIGIALSYVIQTRLWPETEHKPLALRVGALLEQFATRVGAIGAPPAQAR